MDCLNVNNERLCIHHLLIQSWNDKIKAAARKWKWMQLMNSFFLKSEENSVSVRSTSATIVGLLSINDKTQKATTFSMEIMATGTTSIQETLNLN
jgi:hypothetical protein